MILTEVYAVLNKYHQMITCICFLINVYAICSKSISFRLPIGENDVVTKRDLENLLIFQVQHAHTAHTSYIYGTLTATKDFGLSLIKCLLQKVW